MHTRQCTCKETSVHAQKPMQNTSGNFQGPRLRPFKALVHFKNGLKTLYRPPEVIGGWNFHKSFAMARTDGGNNTGLRGVDNWRKWPKPSGFEILAKIWFLKWTSASRGPWKLPLVFCMGFCACTLVSLHVHWLACMCTTLCVYTCFCACTLVSMRMHWLLCIYTGFFACITSPAYLWGHFWSHGGPIENILNQIDSTCRNMHFVRFSWS